MTATKEEKLHHPPFACQAEVYLDEDGKVHVLLLKPVEDNENEEDALILSVADEETTSNLITFAEFSRN